MIEPSIYGIYDRLQDDLSREIFLERLKYSFTGGFRHGGVDVDWVGLLRSSVPGVFREWSSFLVRARSHALSEKELYIFGASNCGEVVLDRLRKENVFDKIALRGFVDNHKSGTFLGYPVLPFDAVLARGGNSVVIIANSQREHARQIGAQIATTRFTGEAVRFLDHDALFGCEYFGVFEPSREEVFVDAGCFDGDTTLEFVKWSRGGYKRIFAFEMERRNFEKCQAALYHVRDCEVIESALSERSGTCAISVAPENRAGTNTIDRVENTANADIAYIRQASVKCVRLDDVLAGSEATFIKMDIEGAEAAALRGARGTIQKYKPKLAIAVYHKPEDILELPLLILQYHKNYRLYLRHYSPFGAETCLYAM